MKLEFIFFFWNVFGAFDLQRFIMCFIIITLFFSLDKYGLPFLFLHACIYQIKTHKKKYVKISFIDKNKNFDEWCIKIVKFFLNWTAVDLQTQPSEQRQDSEGGCMC